MSVSVNFYCLKIAKPNGKRHLACHLANTAYRKGHNVYVNAENSEDCMIMNQLLWTFSPNSYVPHSILREGEIPNLEKFPVVVGCANPPEIFDDVLISLQVEIPDYAKQFKRVVEPINGKPSESKNFESKYQEYEKIFCTKPNIFHI